MFVKLIDCVVYFLVLLVHWLYTLNQIDNTDQTLVVMGSQMITNWNLESLPSTV